MARQIDPSALPRKPYGTRSHIDWAKAVGSRIPFQYDEIHGELTVLAHQKGNYVVIGCGTRQKRLRTNQLMECKFHELVYPDNRMLHEIDFSQIPVRLNRYDWVHSAGAHIPFQFNGTRGVLMVIGYSSVRGMGYLTVSYEGKQHRIRTINLLNGKIAGIIGFGRFQYACGQVIQGPKKNLCILNRARVSNNGSYKIMRKKYQYHCNLCGYEGWTDETALTRSAIVCANCAGKSVQPGQTDLAAEAPWMIPYFQPQDRPLIHTCRKYSSRKIHPVCPACGCVRPAAMAISTIYVNHSMHCPRCSDGRSYPEKFFLALMEQLHLALIYHPTKAELPWCRPYIYDFYDPARQILIETNGMHHYEEVRHYSRTLSQVQESDRAKRALARSNGIPAERYLVLDCRYSTLEYMKQSLLSNRKFRSLYPFRASAVDWKKCDAASAKSLYWEIYQQKQSNPSLTQAELALRFQVSKCTVSKALNRLSGLPQPQAPDP